MTINDKFLSLIGKFIYNKALDKYGHISSLNISDGFGGYYFMYNVFYDAFDSDHLLSIDDFLKGKVQFAIIKSLDTDEIFSDYHEREEDEIKTCFGDDFFDDMIIHITEEEKKAKDEENDKRATQIIYKDLIPLTEISIEALSGNFYLRELYKKYKRRVIPKEKMLYAMINHLCKEMKDVLDSNLKYFFDYEFSNTIKSLEEEDLDDEETRSD